MLVSDLILAVLPRIGRAAQTSGISIYQAANSIQSLIYKNLLNSKSDLLATGELDLTIPAYGYYATLPNDFVAPAERPHSEELFNEWMAGAVTTYNNTTGALVLNSVVSNGTSTLTSWYIALAGVPGTPAYNIGSSTTSLTTGTGSKSITTQAGLGLIPGDYLIVSAENTPSNYVGRKRILEPNYLGDDQEDHDNRWWESYQFYGESFESPAIKPSKYKIIGSTIYVRPKVIIDIAIKGKYFAMPTDITLPTQTILWKGLFDEIFREGAVMIITKGIAILEDNPSFLTFFNREFNYVMQGRNRAIPQNQRVGRGNFL